MSFLGKTYSLYKQENFEDFLKFTGLTDDKVQAMTSFTASSKLVKSGDSYTFTSQNIDGPKEVTFKSGEEFDDVLGPNQHPIKTKYVLDGNTLTQTAKSDRGTVTFKREFGADELVLTITADNWDGVAKRFYKA